MEPAPPAAYAQAWERDLERLRSRWGPHGVTIEHAGGEFTAADGFGAVIASARDGDVLDSALSQRSAQQSMDPVRERHGHIRP